MAVVAAPKSFRSGLPARGASEYCIELGLLNNMPDGALDRTERQFFALLGAAAPDILVRVSFFSLSGVVRGAQGSEHIRKNSYRNAAELFDAQLDALIVTGTEPRLPDVRLEPYWTELTGIFDWVSEDGPSAVFSCLGAHAAVLHYDGVERQRLADKRFGVFDHVVAAHDCFTEHLSQPLRIAHSRWNEVNETALASSGYRILTWAPKAGVDLFVKRRRTDLLFCQGHPEYDPASLGREYRRDVRRFLAGESEIYPALPKDYFHPSEAVLLSRFRERALADRRESLIADYPAPRRRPDARWQPPAAPVFRAWLGQ
ncbi:MAG TPA: homoserine O-succinyltransferase, partial [Rhizomicrobium sp.]